MKASLCLLVIVILLSNNQSTSGNTVWSDELKVNKSYSWRAEKAELRDLQNEEKYNFGIGGNNVKGGSIVFKVSKIPDANSHYISGDKLEFKVTIEGDMISGYNNKDNYYEDWILLVLPLSVNESRFFDIFLQEIKLIENITRSEFVSSEFLQKEVSVSLRYMNTHDVKYIWNLSTGFLKSKEVVSSSGKMLRVIQGDGSGFGLSNPVKFNNQYILFGYSIVILVRIIKLRSEP